MSSSSRLPSASEITVPGGALSSAWTASRCSTSQLPDDAEASVRLPATLSELGSSIWFVPVEKTPCGL
jgi:hypothetical protein